MNDILKKATLWLCDTFDIATQKEIQDLIDNDTEELTERFYKDLSFGTGGMRGIVGAGTNRINKYTLGKATQGLSNYLNTTFSNEPIKVAIGYDCRHDSKWLSEVVANILSANGIQVFLFEDLRPTPELSFAVTHLNCQAGIVLTASHNPPEYNGYKVYWADGGQIVPPQDQEIIAQVNAVEFSQINFKANTELITVIGKSVDEAFYKASLEHGTFNIEGRKNLKIVFTSLHGTSITLIPEILSRAGYSQVHIVEQQASPDGDFPTVSSPNPEEPEALEMAIALAEKVNADIVLGTDPDSDRIGIAVRDQKGKLQLLNGNQTMAVMTDFLIKQWKDKGKLNGKQFVGSTIVSTPLIETITNHYQVATKLGLTGFKWIAKMIKDYPELEFIGGGEESYGYMVGDFVRDKDAVTSALLACEIAANAKANASSFYQELLEIYQQHGFYKEHLISLVKKGREGASEIQKMLLNLRTNPLTAIDGEQVKYVYDYQKATKQDLLSQTTTTIDLPTSNVLIFETENGTRVACRPSGTEPKIKFYISVNSKLDQVSNYEEVSRTLDAKIKRIAEEILS